MKPQEPAAHHVTFEAIYAASLTGHTAFKQTAEHALSIGLRPDLLLQYVRGELKSYALVETSIALGQSPWATSRVVALTKAARNPASLGSKLLSSTHMDPYAWGMKNTGDEDLDMCRLLEQV